MLHYTKVSGSASHFLYKKFHDLKYVLQSLVVCYAHFIVRWLNAIFFSDIAIKAPIFLCVPQVIRNNFGQGALSKFLHRVKKRARVISVLGENRIIHY